MTVIAWRCLWQQETDGNNLDCRQDDKGLPQHSGCEFTLFATIGVNHPPAEKSDRRQHDRQEFLAAAVEHAVQCSASRQAECRQEIRETFRGVPP